MLPTRLAGVHSVLASLTLLCSLCFSVPGHCAEQIQVEAMGTGATKFQALEAAWAEAVRNAVGMFTAAKTEMLNDEITEKIASYSRGQVNAYRILHESNEGNLWTVSIQANVDKDVILETAQATQTSSINIAGANLAASRATKDTRERDAEALIDAAIHLRDLRPCLDYNVEFVQANVRGADKMFLKHIVRMNFDKFMRQSKELEKVVASVATSVKQVPLKDTGSKALSKGIEATRQTDYPVDPKMAEMTIFEGSQAYRVELDFPAAGLSWSDQDKYFCFLQDTATAACYALPQKIVKKLNKSKRFTPRFQAKAGEGYNSVIATGTSKLYFSFKSNRGYMLAPFLNHVHEDTVLVYLQELSLSNEQLAKLTNLHGEYALQETDSDYYD